MKSSLLEVRMSNKQNVIDTYVTSYAEQLLKWRYLVIIACFAVVAGCAYGMKNLYFESDYRVFFAKDDEKLLAFAHLQESYSRSDNVLMLVVPSDGKVFKKETLRLVYELSEASWTLPFSQRVDSISNFQNTFSDEDGLMVESLIEDPNSLNEKTIQTIKSIALKEDQLLNKVITKNADVTAINVAFFLPGESDSEFKKIGEGTEALVKEYEAKYPGHKIMLTGTIMANHTMQKVVLDDATSLIPFMWFIVFLTLYLMLRSLSAVITTIVIIVFSVLCALGIMGWANIYLSGPSSSIPIIIVTMAVADCIHILVTYFHNLNIGKDKHSAIVESLRVNFGPIFVTSLTTSVGFLSMNFSDVPPFQHLGNIVAIGVFFAFAFSITFLPTFISLMPGKGRHEGMKANRLTAWIAENVIQYKNIFFWGTIILGFGAAFAVTKNEINDQFIEYFDESLDFRKASNYAADHLSGLTTIELSLKSGSPNGIVDIDFLKQTDKFHQWLMEQPEVLQVSVVTDTFKRLNRSMHGDNEAYFKLPDNNELAAQYLLLYEMSLPLGLDLTNQINFDKSATRLSLTLKSLSTNEMLYLEQKINQWLDTNTQDIEYIASGQSLMFSHIGVNNARSMIKGTFIALLIISFILILMLRSFRYGLISLAPNLIPAIFTFALWGITVGEVGISIAISIGMTLGIVVDSTVHFLSKYARARKEERLNAEAAVRYAFSNVGVALLVTNLVLVAGFIVLSQSNLRINSDMGIFTALTFMIALTVDFFFLPALLLISDKNKPEQEPQLIISEKIQDPAS